MCSNIQWSSDLDGSSKCLLGVSGWKIAGCCCAVGVEQGSRSFALVGQLGQVSLAARHHQIQSCPNYSLTTGSVAR